MILNELTLWAQSSKAQQLEAINAFIAEYKLEQDFEFVGLESFQCGAHQYNIGVFKHLVTGMIFHLLPGSQAFKPGLNHQQFEYVKTYYSMDLIEYYPLETLDTNGEPERVSIVIPPMLMSRFAITESVWIKHNGVTLHKEYGADHPIDAVARHDIQSWAYRLKLSLPSDMEWEYACRAGSNTLFYWGDEPDPQFSFKDRFAGIAQGYRTYAESEQSPCNAFGLLGMIGNQAEWVLDDIPHYRMPPQAYPLILGGKDDGLDGILRGGWHDYSWNFNRSTSRIRCGATDSRCSGRLVLRLADRAHYLKMN
ncbi:formylglycine-generating enzyme family protein [Pseudoalteromonas luteoviolacea]|uniref:Sulfatase-modifying factor enzyme-like domain-containing protein n=1 Tax=Pseudoalteromonas luteoviolacea NCIMB 1942 TaxID=1365253 RepID=A0A167A4T3_9GAMM|nr:SUMF1/EgtB/PvdO family nonheme iron enzyme [Pseudoalteromonas luteoviolacea]KZN44986.1 hypothetical protein N482_03005 [Pseudoalteromonas luteoviolacea NCIMB 1942]